MGVVVFRGRGLVVVQCGEYEAIRGKQLEKVERVYEAIRLVFPELGRKWKLWLISISKTGVRLHFG